MKARFQQDTGAAPSPANVAYLRSLSNARASVYAANKLTPGPYSFNVTPDPDNPDQKKASYTDNTPGLTASMWFPHLGPDGRLQGGNAVIAPSCACSGPTGTAERRRARYDHQPRRRPFSVHAVQRQNAGFGRTGRIWKERGDEYRAGFPWCGELANTAGAGVINAVENPMEAASRLGDMVQHPVSHAEWIYRNLITPIGKSYEASYGSLDGLNHKLYEDPFGAFTDAAALVGGGASLVGKVAGAAGAADVAEGAARVGDVAGAAMHATSPVSVATKGIRAVTRPLVDAVGNITENAAAKRVVDAARSSAETLQDTMNADADKQIGAAFAPLDDASRQKVGAYALGNLPKDTPMTPDEVEAVRFIKARANTGAETMGLAPEDAERRAYGPLASSYHGKPLPDVTAEELDQVQRAYKLMRWKGPIPEGMAPLPVEEQGPAYLHSGAGQAQPGTLMQGLDTTPPTQGYQRAFNEGNGQVDPVNALKARAYQEATDTANKQYAGAVADALGKPVEGGEVAPGHVPFNAEATQGGGHSIFDYNSDTQTQIPAPAAQRMKAFANVNNFGKLTPALKVFNAATNTAKAAMLPLRPAWLMAHATGDTLRALIGSSPLEGGGGLVRGGLRYLNGEWRQSVPDTVRLDGFQVEPQGPCRLPGKAGEALTSLYQTPAGNALTYPVRAGYGVARGLQGLRRSVFYLDSLPNAASPLTGWSVPGTPGAAMMDAAEARTNDVLGNPANYGNLSPWEMKYARRALPFYGFAKDAARFGLTAPGRYPVGFKALQLAGDAADRQNRKAWLSSGVNRDDLPPWLQSGTPNGQGQDGQQKVIMPGHGNPFTPMLDVAQRGPLDWFRSQANPIGVRPLLNAVAPPPALPPSKAQGPGRSCGSTCLALRPRRTTCRASRTTTGRAVEVQPSIQKWTRAEPSASRCGRFRARAHFGQVVAQSAGRLEYGMEDTTPQLNPGQEKALVGLLTKPKMVDAAKVAGVSVVTLNRWLKEPTFKAAYMEARRESVSQAVAQLQQAGGRAVAVLVEIMEDTEAPTSSRVAAAGKVLDTSIKAVELDDLAARIKALEAFQGGPA